MSVNDNDIYYHNNSYEWKYTTEGKPRGYIQSEVLRELWFHTGTLCNLNCSFCLEGSGPTSTRIDLMTLADAQPFIDEAVDLGVEKFSFTGGEPFINPDFIDIVSYALEYKPCLVLTNATYPLNNSFSKVVDLRAKPNQLDFRVSLDYPDALKHDKYRGDGNFALALEMIHKLQKSGFNVSVARQSRPGEDVLTIEQAYIDIFVENGITSDIKFVAFPDLLTPNATPEGIPEITESCMTTYKTELERNGFMCNFSKMIIKKEGITSVYACTLVDDDIDYELAQTIKDAMKARVMLRHHRCFACFSSGTSCSES